MTVFEYNDYKKFLVDLIDERKRERGYQTKLAEAAGCQRAFVSQVIHGKVHLTFDHAAGLCEYWKFQSDETEYFFELLQFARAGTQALKKLSFSRQKAIKARQSEISARIKSAAKLAEKDQVLYYSSWMYAAVHVTSSIPQFQRESALADRLKLPLHQITKVLAQLERMGLMQRDRSGKWFPSERNLFLPKQSHMTVMQHSNWRNRALLDVQMDEAHSIHYSTLHAMSIRDIEKFKEMVFEFIKQTKALVEPSTEEDVVCLCLDFFEV